MRLFLIDPGLVDNRGHHANACRLLSAASRARHIETRIIAHRDIDHGLAAELDATPLFRAYSYWLTDGDPVCGWLNAFESAASLTRQDLAQLADIRGDDLVFWNSAQPAGLMAAIEWLADLAPERRPSAVVEIGTDIGLEVATSSGAPTMAVPDPRRDPRPMLFRFVAGHMAKAEGGAAQLVCYHATMAQLLKTLLDRPVAVLPFPYQATKPLRSRAGKRPVTIAALGHQRSEKGYHFLPAIIKALMRRGAVRFLIHNSAPENLPEVGEALRRLAIGNPTIQLVAHRATGADWDALIDAADLMLCPYDAKRYLTTHSGIVVEAIANAIPLVVPAGTPLAAIVSDYGGAATVFDRFDAASVIAATEQAIADFDRHAALALGGAQIWRASQGADHLLSALLERAAKS